MSDGDLRPEMGTQVTFAPTHIQTLQDMADNDDYVEQEKPDCAPPTPRRMKGTRGAGSKLTKG